MLAQNQEDGLIHPIVYLQPHERTYRLEGLGVVWAIDHFRPYLSCEVFYSALTSLLNTPQPSGKLAYWGMAIQELNVKITYQSSWSNVNADTQQYPRLMV